MKPKALFIIYGSNNSHFLNLETTGKYLFKIFTEAGEADLKEVLDEFHFTYTTYLHQYFIGPFPDSNEVRKMAFEMGEHFEVERVYLVDKDQYSACLLNSHKRSEIFQQLIETGDEIKIDLNSSNNSLWDKIFN